MLLRALRSPAMLFLAWTLIVCAGVARANEVSRPLDREFVATSWDTRDGLPQASALSMVQTPDGYLWFGTFAGLVRFDGVRFEVFDRTRAPLLPSNNVVRLCLDRQHRVWIGTDRGVAVMRNGQISAFPDADHEPSGLVEAIVEDGQGRIVISGPDREIRIVDGERAHILDTPGSGNRGIHDKIALASSAGRIYAERELEIFLLNEAGDSWEKIADLPQRVLAIGARRAGGIWVSTESAIFAVERGKNERTYEHDKARPEDFGTLFETKKGELWLTSHIDGATRYRSGLAPLRYSRATGFAHDSTRFVFEDDENNLWVGTDGAGLVRLRHAVFRTFSLEENMVKAVLEEGDQRWLVATHGGGLVRFEQGRFSAPLKTTTDREASPYWVWSLLKAKDGSVWAGFFEDGVTRLIDQTIERPVFPENKNYTVRALAQDDSGDIYVGTESGLFRAVEGKLVAVPLGEFHAPAVLALLARRDGVWVGTEEHGLWRVSAGGVAETIPPLAKDRRAITAIAEDSRGAAWVAIDGGHIVRFANGNATELGLDDGLPHARHRAMIDDGRGTLWLASNRGVFGLDIDRFARPITYRHFDEHVGLPNLELTGVTRLKNGELVFSSLGGLAILDPAELGDPVLPLRVRFEDVEIVDHKGNKLHQDASVSRIEIRPGASSIHVRYSAPTFVAPEHVRFDLEIEGPERSSVHRLEQRRFELLHPAPGSYRLRLDAVDTAGSRSKRSAELELFVARHFWQAPWFRGGVALIVLAMIAASVSQVYRRRLLLAQEKIAQAQKLRLAEERHRELVDTSQSMIWALDAEGRFQILTGAAEEIYGRRPEEMIGLELTHASKDAAADRAFLEKLKNETGSADHYTIHLRKDGRDVHLRMKAVVRRDRQGHLLGFAGTAIDVTEEQLAREEKGRVERKMQEAQRLESLGLLAGGVAHDFNNLLTTTMLNVDYLKSQPATDPDAAEALAAIETVSQRASMLCRQMLAYSGRGRFEQKTIDLHLLAASTAKLVRACAPKDVAFEFDFCPNPPAVIGDEAQMGQVLMNLLLNGAEAIGEKPGRVLTRTRAVVGDETIFRDAAIAPKNMRQKFLVLSAIDDGCGMSREAVQRIFDPFYTTKSTGRGLGLAAVLGIVRGHDGGLRVQSEPGRGSTFEVWLPAVEPALTGTAIKTVKHAPATTTMSALVIDDEPPIRSALMRILSRRGVRVDVGENGRDAVEMFAAGRYDVVFLDVTMPVLSGVEALGQMRERAPDQPVVMMSGYDVASLDVDQGVFAFLAKPFRVDDVDRILEQIRALRRA